MLLAAHAPFVDVRRHLRTYLTVETQEGEALSFRLYGVPSPRAQGGGLSSV